MKTPLLRQPMRFFTLLMAVALLGTSCSKDKDDKKDSGFPRTVTVEYKVTSNSSLNKADVGYTNETLGRTDIDDAALPFYKKVDIKLTEPVAIGISSASFVGGNLKLEIIVNGKSVAAQEFNSNSTTSGIVTHTFAQ
jgi:hypothetical protein